MEDPRLSRRDHIQKEKIIKISGGKYKSRNFYMPAGIRPTQNIARKAIFDIVGHDL
ncbi:MAG: RsmD family RNA methyltransferase, partial [Candidatus Omnitrophica bacterium]|nr:RsmD family RNA methyltransferase [Candidatus Omnitrophota bacterium]